MKGLHVDPHASTPQEFATLIRTGLADWQAVAQAAGIRPQ
jgi:tripartite-type tricarboxylate transporter receptor subunit TctC